MLKDSEISRPLPQGLRQRLRDIPRHEVLCRDVDRLYQAARARARRGAAGDPAAEQHLAECSRCRPVYDTLSTAFTVRRLPLPRRLARELSAIARNPRRLLPIWIADTRYAAAACYLLAALTLSVAGDAAAVFGETTAAVSSKAQVWVDEGEERGLEAWDAATATVGKGFDEGWGHVTRAGDFFSGAVKTIETTTNELIPGRDRPVEGDQDGRSRDDGNRTDNR